jgi:cytoskeletal protein CcmA (bactofilin family)
MWALGEKNPQASGNDENFTFLGKGVDFKGVIDFDGTIRIDGRLEGEVRTTGALIVGEHAVIKGIILARTMMNSGKINGTVIATENVQILKPGVLIGDIRTPAIAIEDGAHFHGMCDMGAHKWVEEPSSPNKNVYDLTSHRGKVRSSDL